ncbi:flagellar hook-length control protein FliK [Desulfocurvibacter africanus]|uniref:flagellar hook-length control protein FliK n=1 Tax=Desulfocurvibacter africanus TaxID=873 RepID=UPI0004831926|nr:flagellar hook-length control protein FliK [Desulfocurvibacter africanus]
MQILPCDGYGREAGTTSSDWSLSSGSEAASAFAGLLSQHVASNNPTTTSDSSLNVQADRHARANSEERLRAEADSPAGRAVADRKVGKEEYSTVREELRAQGYAESDLDRLEQRVSEGVTWREFQRDLSELARKARLGNSGAIGLENVNALQSLFQKAGFSGAEAESLVKSLDAGNSRQVLEALKRQLESLPADKTLSLRPAELKALGDALGLNARGKESLRGYLNQGTGANGRMLASPESLRGILTVMQNESTDGLDYIQRMDAMQKLVGDVLQQARTKASGEANADRMGQDAGDKLLNASKNDMKTKHAQGLGEKHADKAGEKTDDSIGDKARDEHLKDLGNRAQDKLTLPKTQPLTSAVADAGAQVKTNFQVPTSPTQSVPSQAQLFQQVNSGILQNLGNGGQQLTINLTPEELGSLQVMLQVRDKELSAVIRADSPEAAKALSDQLAQLKQTLEQQGFKVSSLEVQTGLSNQHGFNAWSGAEGHNFLQERQERARMQRLSSLRGQTAENGITTQAPVTAGMGRGVSSDSVDIFA